MKYIRHPQLLTKIDSILVIFNEMAEYGAISGYLDVFTRYVESACLPELKDELMAKISAYFKGGDEKMSKIIEELTKDAVAKARIEAKAEVKSKDEAKAEVYKAKD